MLPSISLRADPAPVAPSAAGPARPGVGAVLAVALAALAVKLVIAATTPGTNDILHWQDFVNAVQKYGPVKIYGVHLHASLYNHPPLMGYVLEGVNGLRNLGVPLRFTIRAVASVADVVSALVVYALLRRRRRHWEAVAGGVIVAGSPVLFLISGYHGNTDPLFTMLVLLSTYLLVDRRRAAFAGVALGLAVGVKIVAIVAVPVLLAYVLRRGWPTLLRFAGAAAVVFLITWTPAILGEWKNLDHNVLQYPGLGLAQWGFMQIGHHYGDPGWVSWAQNSGRTVIVAACGVIPALGVLRRPSAVVPAVGLALCAFLACTPQFAVQYLAWGAAASVLICLSGAVAYNLAAGVLLYSSYNYWSRGFFWMNPRTAYYHPQTFHQLHIGYVAWTALVLSCLVGLRRVWTAQPEQSPALVEDLSAPAEPVPVA